MLTVEFLRSKFNYNPLTGVFVNRRTGLVAGSDDRGYVILKINGKRYKAHRVAWFITYGYWPSPTTDHKNRIRDDNRLDNLREASFSLNAQNRLVLTHGDVYWRPDRNKWRTRLRVSPLVRISIGHYNSKQEAVRAYKIARNRHPWPLLS